MSTAARATAAAQLEHLQGQMSQLLEGMGLDPDALPEPAVLPFDPGPLEALLATTHTLTLAPADR